MDTEQKKMQIARISNEQLRNEFDYIIAQQMLKDMLEKNLITVDEFNKISALNLQKFSPELSSIIA